MALVLREDIGRKLTISELDGNFTYLESISGGGGGTNSVISLSFTQSVGLISDNQVVQGQLYLIKDTCSILYGSESSFNFGAGTDIILTGLDSSNFSKNGWGKFYNPMYYNQVTNNGFPVWDSTGNTTYNIGDAVIFGGQVWQNTSGSIGSAGGYFTLDSDNWELLSYTSTYFYNVTWDEIEFDFATDEELFESSNGYIVSRYDAINNNLVKMESFTNLFWCDVSPIQMFRWGHRFEDGGVANCVINDSYFGCLNYIHGQISGINLTNAASIFDFQMINNSSFFNSSISNGGNISSIVLDNSVLANLNINNSYYNDYSINNSGLYSCNIKNSTVFEINLINDSTISNFDVYNSSIYNISLENSYISNDSEILSLTSSNMYNIDLKSNSYINNIYFSNTSLHDINLSNESSISNIQSLGPVSYISMTNECSLNQINVEDSDSSVSNIVLTNESYIDCGEGGFYLNNNSSIDYINLSNNSYMECGEGGLNLNNSTLFNIDFSNNSGMWALLLMTSSSINCLKMNNNSMLKSGYSGDNNMIGLYTSQMQYIEIDNNSFLADVLLENSQVGYVSLDNISSMYDMILTTGSNIDALTMIDSQIYSNSLDNTNIYDTQMNESNISTLVSANSTLSNAVLFDSIIYSINLYNSNITDVLLKNGSIYQVNLNQGSMESVELYDSTLFGSTISNTGGLSRSALKSSVLSNSNISNTMEFIYLKNSRFTNFIGTSYSTIHLDMSGSSFDFGLSYSDIPNYTEFMTNTLKYKFNIEFDGTEGSGGLGAINIGQYIIPSGFYIEKIIMDASNLSANSSLSTINIGITNHTSSGLSASSLGSDFVKVSDISNGGATGYKTTDDDYLNASIIEDVINSGTIYLEVTLKNTNYGYNND